MANHKKETQKDAVSKVDELPNRRSRGERIISNAVLTSFPHCVIGNVVSVIYGRVENAVRSALTVESKLDALSFIRRITFESNGERLKFEYATVDLVKGIRNSDAINGLELEEHRPYVSSDTRSIAALANSPETIDALVAHFHRATVVGRTIINPIGGNGWCITTLNGIKQEGGTDLRNLVQDKTETPSTLAEVKAYLSSIFMEDKYTVTLTPDSITIRTETINAFITFVK